jgi:ParB family chromosome partitioning protein
LPENIKEQIIQSRLNVSQAIELTTLSASRQAEIVGQVVGENLTVREIREIKSALSKHDSDLDGQPYAAESVPKPARIAKKASLTLRVTLSRLDNLIEEVHSTVEPDQRAEIISMLMDMRRQVHSMIDDAIKFKNSVSKK